jgi:hypothetical protein
MPTFTKRIRFASCFRGGHRARRVQEGRAGLKCALDANVVLDPYGLSDELIDSLVEDVALPMRRLADLIAEAVDPDILAGEDDPRRALAKLREELEAALQSVRQAEARLPC